MVVGASRTVTIPLRVPGDRTDDFHATSVQYQQCQNAASDYCWNDPKTPDDLITTKKTVEDDLYHPLKEQTDLNANLVQKAFKDVTAATTGLQTTWKNGDRVSKPEWRERPDESYTMTYDKRAATYNQREATFATVNGTVDCQYELPKDIAGTPYERYVLDSDWSFTTSKLVYDGHRFHLHAVLTRTYTEDSVSDMDSDTHSENRTRVLGVDLNVKGYSAVTSAGGFHGNADHLNHRREQYEALRGELQETGTRSAHLRLQQRSSHEGNWFDQYAHDVANSVVADAVRVGATHVAVEDLTRIRKRISNQPEYQQWLFRRIQEYVEYKLEEFGIEFEQVDARYTSQSCSRTDCEHVAEANRDGKEFCCGACGYELDADLNAAKTIALKLLSELPASHTCSSGKATSQLALVSGALTPAGEFSRQDWSSTDKPHPQ
jgi:transposase, IS605 OrfB family, central region